MSQDPTKKKETDKTKMVTPRSVAVKEKEKKKKKKSKDKDKQWCHSTGKKSQEENSKKYGDGENCWEGI